MNISETEVNDATFYSEVSKSTTQRRRGVGYNINEILSERGL